MHLFGAITVLAFLAHQKATCVQMPHQIGLSGYPNYDKIKQSFPNKSDDELLAIRAKLDSLKAKFTGSIHSNSAPLNVTSTNYNSSLAEERKSYTVLNKNIMDFLWQGDVALTLQQLNEMSSAARKKRKAASNPALKWPTEATGIIPYTLSADLTARKVSIIQAAVKFWEDNTCLKFQLNGAGTNTIRFFNGDGCFSTLGMIGGVQDLSIGQYCDYFATVAHEIAHALGFYHEQSRYDRDDHVIFNLDNIQPDMAYNYGKATPAEMNLYNVPYEYGSVMHYASGDFAINSSIPVMIARDRRYQQTMGNGRGPSFLDVLTMNRHYGCDAKCASSTTACKNGGFPNPKNCNKCICPASFGGDLCDELSPAANGVCGTSYIATTDWQSFSATVGTTSILDNTTTCFWQLKSPPGTYIEVKLTLTFSYCALGCFWNHVEIGVEPDFTKSGIRHCCPEDIPATPYLSSTNLVPIIAYGDFQTSFKIEYRYVSISTTTTTTTSTTTTPTTTTSIMTINPVTTTSAITTTLEPHSCPSGQIWSYQVKKCIVSCVDYSQWFTATSDWRALGIGMGYCGTEYSCYWPIVAPFGTQIQVNVTNLMFTVCTPGCTNTSLAIRDGLQPPANYLCCANDLPSYTMGNMVYIEVHEMSGISWNMAFRYIGTPLPTTVGPPTTVPSTYAPQTCPSNQIWSTRTGLCLSMCVPESWTFNATEYWTIKGIGVNNPGCWWSIVSPVGTQVQLNITRIYQSVCDPGCTVTSVAVSDNFLPPSPSYCCLSDMPTFTMNSNRALLIIHAPTTSIHFQFYFRYIGTPGGTTTTVPVPVTSPIVIETTEIDVTTASSLTTTPITTTTPTSTSSSTTTQPPVTPSLTITAAPPSCPSEQLWNPHRGTCSGICGLLSWNATDSWQSTGIGFMIGISGLVPNGCYFPITSPVGTQVQVRLDQIPSSTCDDGCTRNSFAISDNFQTPSAVYCCNNFTEPILFTTTSNNALMVLHTHNLLVSFSFLFSWRYVNISESTTLPPTTTTNSLSTSASATTTTTVATLRTTLAPQPCPIGQLWSSHTGVCVGQCATNGYTFNAEANWAQQGIGFAPNLSSGCYWQIVSPAGTKVQVNVTNIYNSVCDAGCTTTSLAFSDNFLPSSPSYCCSSDKPEFTMTSNKALMVVHTTTASMSYNVYFRYIGTPGATSKAAPTTTTIATTKATTKVTTKATTKPTTKATTKPTTKATTKPTTKATTKPTTKATTKPTTKATTKKAG